MRITSRYKIDFCGIYRIRNVKNGKFYIGSTSGTGARWYNHQKTLTSGIHCNQYLQNAWNKYGKDAFVFEMVEFCKKQDLLIKEQQYLDQHVGSSICYNLNRFATGGRQKCATERDKLLWKRRRSIKTTNHFIKLFLLERGINDDELSIEDDVLWKIRSNIIQLYKKENLSKQLKGTKFSRSRRTSISRSKIGVKRSTKTIEKIRKNANAGWNNRGLYSKKDFDKMKSLYKTGNYTQKQIADMYEPLSYQYISKILRNIT